jgi:hypothetical protein
VHAAERHYAKERLLQSRVLDLNAKRAAVERATIVIDRRVLAHAVAAPQPERRFEGSTWLEEKRSVLGSDEDALRIEASFRHHQPRPTAGGGRHRQSERNEYGTSRHRAYVNGRATL